MKVEGYMVEAEWDGQSLTARGTNAMGRTALLGQDHKASWLPHRVAVDAVPVGATLRHVDPPTVGRAPGSCRSCGAALSARGDTKCR